MGNNILSLHEKCCGCSACMQACPKKCIIMKIDLEGFWYPKIKKSLCIDCHYCEKVCPVLHLLKKTDKTPVAYAAYSNEEYKRLNSSSGGIFTHLAEYILGEKGVVFGASFNEDYKSVKHILVENENDLGKLRGSKYLQSDINETYKIAKEKLDSGCLVLFTGTPCQIEGLICFLQKDYENLLLVDVVCHGVPSPKIWRDYLKKFGDSIKKVSFRD